ncbi:MAG: ribbon-helix-helix domain-containing protein [Oscillospiraceae bacterium]|jgi:predicted HicB family RNase H-like nuclease|nr:ribbon-helix-helix domain-containing protein [Oscillospiraceae bacterium]
MDKKFIVGTKNEPAVTMTIRIDAEDNAKLEAAALKSGLSRNKIINMAIKFALENLEFVDGSEKKD